jgi:hypothetical protein
MFPCLPPISQHVPRPWRQGTNAVRARAQALLDATLSLLRLDLDPLPPLWMPLDSTAPRGRPPDAPLAMCRALRRLPLLRSQRLATFALARRQQPRRAMLAGFQPCAPPAVGTFSLCMDRLEDGPFQPSCPPRVTPAARRHGQPVRHRSQAKAETEAARTPRLAPCDSLPAPRTPQRLPPAAQPRPAALQKRLADGRGQAAVLPSARRGLLGALERMLGCGDGSARATGASAQGNPPGTCRTQGLSRCACDRF